MLLLCEEWKRHNINRIADRRQSLNTRRTTTIIQNITIHHKKQLSRSQQKKYPNLFFVDAWCQCKRNAVQASYYRWLKTSMIRRWNPTKHICFTSHRSMFPWCLKNPVKCCEINPPKKCQLWSWARAHSCAMSLNMSSNLELKSDLRSCPCQTVAASRMTTGTWSPNT